MNTSTGIGKTITMNTMLPATLPNIAPPKPPKATKRDIIEAMAEAILAERQKKNAALNKQINKITEAIKRKSIKHLRRAFSTTDARVTTTNDYDAVAKCYPRCVEKKVVVKLDDFPELKELGDQLTALESQVEYDGWSAKENIKKELTLRTVDRSVIVNGLLGKFRKELAAAGKAMLEKVTEQEKATAIEA